MSLLSRSRVTVFLGLAALACGACGGADAQPANSDDSDITSAASKVLSDAELGAVLATPPAHLTKTQAKTLVVQTLNPVATTARLEMLNDFIASGKKKYDAADPAAPYDTLASEMESIYWATPRDLASTPAGFGGQTFQTSVTMADSAGPTRLKVVGTASKDYKLTFTISSFHVTVDRVPAGSTAEATAKLIAATINASNQKILDGLGEKKCFDAIGGDHASDQSGVDDFEVSSSGATVVILVAINS